MKKDQEKQLTLKNVTMMGISYVFGISYTLMFVSIMAGSKGGNTTPQMGWHIIWIYVLVGALAYVCIRAYVKLINIFPTTNGGTYQYVRTAFGRFWGFFCAVFQYAVLPITIAGPVIGAFKNSFGYIVKNGEGIPLIVSQPDDITTPSLWGWGGHLYLDLIAIGVYLLACSIVLLGGSKFKKYATYLISCIWAFSFLVIILTIVNFAKNGSEPFLDKFDSSLIDFKFSNFNKVVISIFFSYTGLEAVVTMGKQIKNRKKTIPTAINIVIGFVMVFYVVFTLAMFGAIKTKGFPDNPIFQLFEQLKIGGFGLWLMIILTFLIRMNAWYQKTLYGGNILQPLSKEGYISEKFGDLNKDNLPMKAIMVNMSIAITTIILMVILPDIIGWATNGKSSMPFNISDVSGLTSILNLTTYSLAILVVFYFAYKKNITMKWYEWIAYGIAFAFMILQITMFFVNQFEALYKDGELQANPLIKMGLLLAFYSFILIVYFFYYQPKLKKRMSTIEGQNLQKELDEPFQIIEQKSI